VENKEEKKKEGRKIRGKEKNPVRVE